jgi:hypothetical protein
MSPNLPLRSGVMSERRIAQATHSGASESFNTEFTRSFEFTQDEERRFKIRREVEVQM